MYLETRECFWLQTHFHRHKQIPVIRQKNYMRLVECNTPYFALISIYKQAGIVKLIAGVGEPLRKDCNV